MRALVLVLILTACGGGESIPLEPTMGCEVNSPCPPGETSCAVAEPSGLTKSCECIDFGSGEPWWACSTCPFGEGRDPVACTAPGLGCNITNWEHDCFCGCTADGWWDCTPGTVGSMCPRAPQS